MSSQEPIQGTPIADVDSSDTDVDSSDSDVDSIDTDVDPPNNCDTWKSAYAQRLTSKKTGEEFDYFARELQLHPDLQGPSAFLYALAHAYKMTKANDLRDDEKQVKELPKGSKLCIVGAGMAGMCLAPACSN